jgi:hypothetical protein
MGNYEQLKQAVSDVIKTNGNQEITGAIMQNALLTIISTVGDNATFAGIATPTTNPGTPDQNVFYLASEPGVYSNFGGVELTDQVFIFTNKNGNWVKQDSGIATSAKVFELKNILGSALSMYFSSISEQPQGYIQNYYINNNGNFVSQIQQITYYWHVNKGDIIKIEENLNEYYVAYAFFDDIPNINSSPTSYYPYDGYNQYVISPIDGYIAISGYYLSIINLYKSKESLSDIINFNLCRKPIAYNKVATKTIDGYYIKNTGEIIYQAGQYIKYLKVKKGDFVKITASIGTNYSAFALFKEEPTVSSKPVYFRPYTNEKDLYAIIPIDGYIASSSDKTNALNIELGEYKDVNIIEYLSYYFYNSYNVVGTIDNYYFNNVGKFYPQIGQYCQYAFVKKGERARIMGGTNNVYAAWGFFKEIPTIESVPYSFVPYSIYNTYFTAPEDGYILGSADKINNIYILKASEIPNVKKYTGKTCIYIGDSISTLNNYRWKGLLETNYNLNYVRDISEQLAPANGGITIMPNNDDDSLPNENKSIWYRCAKKRMSIYSFDMISLFGGTNDMTKESLKIGTVDDVAYVDNTKGIITIDENCTSEKPAELSFASALKGCILMLKRDFPGKEIVIPTVMPCGGIYGNWTDKDTGLKASEAIAYLQLRVAEKYGLKAIPLYWDMRTTENAAYNWADQWGVHPNYQGALRLQALFAQTLCL